MPKFPAFYFYIKELLITVVENRYLKVETQYFASLLL